MIASLLVLFLMQPTPRHQTAREQFMRQTGYPHGRPGWIVDHRIPLCAGGPDTPANMQWQTVRVARAKDRFEKELCAALRAEGYTLAKRTE
jgi:hypothetical protein